MVVPREVETLATEVAARNSRHWPRFSRWIGHLSFLNIALTTNVRNRLVPEIKISINSLPPELLQRVASELFIVQKPIAQYATISRAWQWAIENHTFSRLSFSNDELDTVKSIALQSPYEHRRKTLRELLFSIHLPSYDDNACGRFERQADRHINDQAFSKAVAQLFTALEVIDTDDRSGPIDLHLLRCNAAMDPDRRDREKLRADRLATSIGKRQDLFALRYRDSHLQLLDHESLPRLYNVVSLTITGDNERKLAPAIIAWLISRLPNLKVADCSFCDSTRRRPDLRRSLRSQLSEQLTTCEPNRLKKFTMKFVSREPMNSSFDDADIRGSLYPAHTDDLSTALRHFSQNAPWLTHLNLGGPICIGPELFEPISATETGFGHSWQVLETFIVGFSVIRPDGDWYMVRDPQHATESSDNDDGEHATESSEDDDGEHAEQEAQVDPEEEEGAEDLARSEASSSGYDSSDSFFAMDQLPPDNYGYDDVRRDARLNGDEPQTRSFRTEPASELEALFLAAANAASRMPRLRYMAVSLKSRARGRGGYASGQVGFKYMVAGVEYASGSRYAVDANRLRWDVPSGWRMSPELESQWTSLLGEEGIIEYDEW